METLMIAKWALCFFSMIGFVVMLAFAEKLKREGIATVRKQKRRHIDNGV